MKKQFICFFISLAAGLLLAGCEKAPTTQETAIVAKPIQLSQQDRITQEFLSQFLTYDKNKLFQSGTRQGEEAQEQFWDSRRKFESELIGTEAKNWECTIAPGTLGGNLFLPIDFVKSSYPADEFSCYGHYREKVDPEFNQNGQMVRGYSGSYELEHYKIKPSEKTKQLVQKLYNGDKIKFSARFAKIDVGIMINQGRIYFDNAEIEVLK